MAHVRKGDVVIVTKGKYKGKRGKILLVADGRVTIEKVAMIKRHTKPTQASPQGGIIDKEGTIAISNVALYDEATSKGTRTKMVVEGDTKVRVGIKSGTKFPTAGL